MENVLNNVFWKRSLKCGKYILVVLSILTVIGFLLTLWNPWYWTVILLSVIPTSAALIPVYKTISCKVWVNRIRHCIIVLISSWKFRWLGLLLVSLVLFLDIGFAGCAYERYKYRSRILNFNWERPDREQLEKLIEAFTMFPNRLEPRIILRIVSRQFVGAASDYTKKMASYKEFLRTFLDDERVKNAALLHDGSQKCVSGWGNHLASDVWYAGMLPERTGDEVLALELLTSRSGQARQAPVANLLKNLLLVDSMERKMEEGKSKHPLDNMRREENERSDLWKEYEKEIQNLETVVNLTTLDDDSILMRSTHYYQEAIDRIGTYYILRCAIGDSREDLHKGIGWYTELLNARDRSIEGTADDVWLRPPRKLAAFHGFLYASEVDTPYHRLVPLFAGCEGFKALFQKRITIAQREAGGRYHASDGWKEHTIYGLSDVRQLINNLLQKGWRYSDVFNTT